MPANKNPQQEYEDSLKTDIEPQQNTGGSNEFYQEDILIVRELRILKPAGLFGVTLPVMVRIKGSDAATAGNYTAPFFIANRSYEVIEVRERHETAGSDAGAVTVMLKKVPSGTAPGSGTNMLTAGINLKATADTNQSGSITATVANRRLARGDAMSLVTTGVLTAVAGVTVEVLLKAI